MKARSREINIFNMSLLDILCGALGAFCFMMLTLFPYYMRAQQKDRTGGGGQQQTSQDSNADQLQRQLAEARAQLQRAEQQLEQSLQHRAAAGDAAALQQELQVREQQLNNARQQLQMAQQQLQAAQQQVQNSQGQLQQAEERLKKFEIIFPMTTQIWWFGPGDVDLYLWGAGENARNPPEPVLGQKMPVFFKGDQRTDCLRGPCSESWMMRDVPRNAPMKVYYILYEMKDSAPVAVLGQVMTAGAKIGLPAVTLDAQHRIVLVGTLRRTPQETLEFKPAVSAPAAGRSGS